MDGQYADSLDDPATPYRYGTIEVDVVFKGDHRSFVMRTLESFSRTESRLQNTMTCLIFSSRYLTRSITMTELAKQAYNIS